MNDDDNAFLQAMADVKPLSQDRVMHNTSRYDKKDYAHKRFIAENHNNDDNPFVDSTMKPVGPNDIIQYKTAGIQNAVFRRLRLGQYACDDQLDLHHHTVAQARQSLHAFLQNCVKHHHRCILILHGKGGREDQKRSVIKSHVAQWLEDSPLILAYHSAPSNKGGAGAVYALLKQSEEAKQYNREYFDTRK